MREQERKSNREGNNHRTLYITVFVEGEDNDENGIIGIVPNTNNIAVKIFEKDDNSVIIDVTEEMNCIMQIGSENDVVNLSFVEELKKITNR